MYYFPGNPQLTCDAPRHRHLKPEPFTAEITTLDEFCSEQSLQQIDFLKIDVEGAEHRVVKGARGMIESGRVSCIQFEYGPWSIGSRFLLIDFYELLGKHYRIGKIFPHYVAFGDYDWRAEDFKFANYLCVRRARDDLLIALGR